MDAEHWNMDSLQVSWKVVVPQSIRIHNNHHLYENLSALVD